MLQESARRRYVCVHNGVRSARASPCRRKHTSVAEGHCVHREVGWEATGSETLVRRMTNAIRRMSHEPAHRCEVWNTPCTLSCGQAMRGGHHVMRWNEGRSDVGRGETWGEVTLLRSQSPHIPYVDGGACYGVDRWHRGKPGGKRRTQTDS